MPTRTLCGAPLAGRGICRKTKGACPDHALAGRPPLEPVRETPAPVLDEAAAPVTPAAARDLRASGWWVLERLLGGDLEPSRASAAATVLRALAALPPDPVSPRRGPARNRAPGLADARRPAPQPRGVGPRREALHAGGRRDVPHLGTPPPAGVMRRKRSEGTSLVPSPVLLWSLLTDSNRGPTLYESAALPAELRRRTRIVARPAPSRKPPPGR